MIATDDQLRRWRAMSEEPVRGAMPRTRSWPSSHGKFIDQKREIAALRAALKEALGVIETAVAEEEELKHMDRWLG